MARFKFSYYKVYKNSANWDVDWQQFRTEVALSRKSDYFFKRNGAPYVFKDLKQGCPLLTVNDAGKWVVCRRITHNTVFLGDKNERISAEYARTPEGIEESKRLWESYKADLGLWKKP